MNEVTTSLFAGGILLSAGVEAYRHRRLMNTTPDMSGFNFNAYFRHGTIRYAALGMLISGLAYALSTKDVSCLNAPLSLLAGGSFGSALINLRYYSHTLDTPTLNAETKLDHPNAEP